MLREAFLIHQDTLYVSRDATVGGRFSSPVAALVSGIAGMLPDRSRAILRERIHTNYPPTPLCEGVVKVAAKRMSMLDRDANRELRHPSPPFAREVEVYAPPALEFGAGANCAGSRTLRPDEVAPFLRALQENARGFKRVSALALGPDGALLGYAWSTAESNQTLHAEWNLARSIFAQRGGELPAGATIHSSLEPCAMCAAMILSLFREGEPVRMSFLEPDPGPAARNTCLKSGSDLWKKAGRPVVEMI